MAWPDKRLIDLFGVELPIVQAPMTNSSGVDMAAAIAEAGGLGSLPCAGLSNDKVRDGVAAIRSHEEADQSQLLLGVGMPKPPLQATSGRQSPPGMLRKI